MSDRGRQSPWPFDCSIGGTGMMLVRGPNKESPWVENKVRYFDPQSVMTAEDRTYAQFPPEIDLPKSQDSFVGGYGASHQGVETKFRYSHTLSADCSSGHPTNGPAVNSQQTLTGGSPRQFITFTISGVEKVYCSVGTDLWRRNDDTSGGSGWTKIQTFAADIGQMDVFRGTQSADYLFIAIGESNNYYVMDNAETLTQHGSQKANGFVRVGDELFLYVLSGNQWILRKTWDGGTAPTWIGNYPVGDSSTRVNNGMAVAGRLVLGKSNGVYVASALVSPLAEDVTPGLHPFNNVENCIQTTIFDENYVFVYDGGLMRYDPSNGSLEQIGPETIDDNQSDIKGNIVAVAAQDGLNIHALIYNIADDITYYAKWGSWALNPNSGTRVLIPSWHASLYEWDKKATCMQVVNLDWGTDGGRIPRLYVGFDDGSVEWFYASRTANPLDDPNYVFNTTDTGYLFLSRFNALFPFEYKVLKHIGLVGFNLSGTNQLNASYKIPIDVSYTSMGAVNQEPGEKINPSGTPTDKAFDIRIGFVCTSPSAPPVLSTVVIYSAIRFENLKEIVAWINVSDRILNRDGGIIRQRWQDIRDQLETVANTSGAVTVISPTGEVLTCLALEFGHALMIEDTETGVYKWISKIRFVQTRSTATRGTWDRAGAYTWDDLSAFTWNEVRVI